MTAFRKIPQKEYCKYIQIADSLTFGKIYPLSIAEGRQAGDIYTDGKAVLFHHLCGFGHIAGEADDAFINSIKELMLNGSRRLVLFADNAIAKKYGEEFAVNISGGTLTLSSGDDGIHADSRLDLSGGAIYVNQSYEGLEAQTIYVSGSTIYVNARDDGFNAAGGNDGSNNMGFFGGGKRQRSRYRC